MINSDFQNKSRVRNVKYVKLISRYITNLVIILNTHYRVASIKLPKGSKKIITYSLVQCEVANYVSRRVRWRQLFRCGDP